MEGIIKFSGIIDGLTYQNYGFITIKFRPLQAYCKGIDEPLYHQVELGTIRFKQHVSITYSGPAHLSSPLDSAFAFSDKIERTCCGVGACTEDINNGDFIEVYLYWQKSDDAKLPVVHQTVIHLPTARPQSLPAFIASLI